MSEPLQIQEPFPPKPGSPQLGAFLELAFRPLYIAGCLWALVSIAIWIFAPQIVPAPLAGVLWHAHEMLWGFVATIAVAFLLTAAATWTGLNPIKGWPLALICLFWVIARVGYLVGGEPAFQVACLSESAFFLISAIALLRVMLKGKSKRNYGIPFLILGLGVSNGLYLQAALNGDYTLLMQRFNLGLICMAVIALLIARRVIPFFAMRMVPDLKIPMLTGSGHVQLTLGVLAIILGLASQPLLMGIALALVGLISLYQVISWKPLAVLHKPLLWILYLGYASLGIGLLFAAASLAGLGSAAFTRSAVHVHIIGMAGFSVLIIGMVTRTALGHLGRPLVLERTMLISYVFIIAAVILRLAALWPSAGSIHLLHAAAACWIAGFALYLWRYIPMLIRPRPDAVAKAAASVKSANITPLPVKTP